MREVLRSVPGRNVPFGPSRENRQGASVYRLGDQARRPPGDPRLLDVWIRRGEHERPAAAGVRRVRIFVIDDLPGLEEAIRKIFPKAE